MPAPDSAPPHVLRAAGLMGVAVLLSRILGLVREQAFAILFGAGDVTDAFYVAFRIPNMLRNLLAEGAMSASLVPVFTRAREEEGERSAWRLAGLVFRTLSATVMIVSALGMLFAPQLVGVFAPAFRLVPGKFELTVRLTRLLFPFFPLVALGAAFMGVLNACGVFFLPALSSALFNLGSIGVGVLLAQILFHSGPRFGLAPIEGMALGVLFGGLLQAGCQLPALYRAGYRWRRRQISDPIWYQNRNLRKMLWMMLPGVIGLAATQISLLINTVLATSQGPGAVSWLNYAFRLMQFPIGIFGVSLASATLPQVSREWVRKDVPAVEKTLTRSLHYVFALNLPASAGLAFLGVPIIELLFQYGHFRPEDTLATATALAMYAVGLTAYSVVKLLVPACYAMGNTRVPVLSSVVAVTMTLVLNLVTVHRFGYWGLALGTSIAALLNAGFLLAAVQKILKQAGGRLEMRPLGASLAKNLCVALVMGVVIHFTYRVLNVVLPDLVLAQILGKFGTVLSRVLKLAAAMLEGLILVLLLSKALGMADVAEGVDIFAKKLKIKLSRGKT